MSASTELVASLPFLGYKQRNLVLDNFFYDTASITLAERANFTPLVDREGSIVVVPPSNSDRKIRHYKRALRFMNKEGPTICAIAIAGVGSSPLGTAALARAVADALDTDVAGIITGYGLSDVMAEALGGWFAFSAADRIRYTMEKFFERMRATMPAGIVTAEGDASPSTLSEILLADPPELEYLVTHSKGSLVASRALQQYVEDLEGDNSKLFKRLRITTLGAVVGLAHAVQVCEAISRHPRLVRDRQFKPRRDARARAGGRAPSQSEPPVSYERDFAAEWRRRAEVVAQACHRRGNCILVGSAGCGGQKPHRSNQGHRSGAETYEETDKANKPRSQGERGCQSGSARA